MSLWNELKRRSVVKVGAAYAVVAWLLIQASSILLPTFGAPPLVTRGFMAVVLLGFPVALVVAWIYDLTPEGFRRTLPLAASLSGADPALGATSATRADGISVAVLPFVDMSPQPDQEHLADGIAEDLIDGLAKVEGLRVLARTSSFAVSNKADIRSLGRQLGVTSVLEGSIRRSNDHLRVTARLVDVNDGLHLWSDTYERRMADIFTIQNDISRSILSKLRLKLNPVSGAGPAPIPTANTEAYEWFLKGRRYWYRRYKVGLQTALGCFQKAIDLDPEFAAPYAGVANTFNSLGIFAFLDPKEALSKSRVAAETALRLDPTMAAAHFALGGVHFFFEWNLAAARQQFNEASALDPSFGEAAAWLAMLTAVEGDHAGAMSHARRAAATEPDSPYIAFIELLVDIWCERRPTVASALDELLEKEPEMPTGLFVAGDLASSNGNHELGLQLLEKAVALTNRAPLFLAGLAAARARKGETSAASALLSELLSRTENEYVTPVAPAVVCAHLGKLDEAFTHVERAVAEHSPSLLVTFLLPLWDCLRGDDRFTALVKSRGIR